MNATELIYTAAGSPEIPVISTQGLCAVCGKKITEGIPIKNVVSNTFTDWNMLADMSAQYACKACSWCIKEPKLRRSQFIATEKELYFFKRDDIEKWLFYPPNPPFVFFVTANYKKHGSFRARINDSQNLFYIQFEDRQILFSPNRYRELFQTMKKMYKYFNKLHEIGEGNYNYKHVMDYGIDKWRVDEIFLGQYRGSQVFNLLLYALNKPEVEIEKETQEDKKT
jgi:CRISPR type IV-associated protein Csf1